MSTRIFALFPDTSQEPETVPRTWQAFNKYCWMEKNKAALNLLWILINHAFFFFASKPLLRWLSLKPYPCPPRKLPDTSLIKCLILCPNFILSNQNYLLVCLTLSKLKDPMSQGLLSWMPVVSSPNSGLRRQEIFKMFVEEIRMSKIKTFSQNSVSPPVFQSFQNPRPSSHFFPDYLLPTQRNFSVLWSESVLVTQSCLTLFNPVDCSQVPLSVEFSRQEYWSRLPFPLPGDLPYPGIEPRSPVLQADSFRGILSHQGSPLNSSSFLNLPSAFWLAVCYIFQNHRLWCRRAVHAVCPAHSPGVWAAITTGSPGTCLHLVPLLSGNVLPSQVATYFGTFPIENSFSY